MRREGFALCREGFALWGKYFTLWEKVLHSVERVLHGQKVLHEERRFALWEEDFSLQRRFCTVGEGSALQHDSAPLVALVSPQVSSEGHRWLRPSAGHRWKEWMQAGGGRVQRCHPSAPLQLPPGKALEGSTVPNGLRMTNGSSLGTPFGAERWEQQQRAQTGLGSSAGTQQELKLQWGEHRNAPGTVKYWAGRASPTCSDILAGSERFPAGTQALSGAQLGCGGCSHSRGGNFLNQIFMRCLIDSSSCPPLRAQTFALP